MERKGKERRLFACVLVSRGLGRRERELVSLRFLLETDRWGESFFTVITPGIPLKGDWESSLLSVG